MPALKDYFDKHLTFIFIGDAAFDSINIYKGSLTYLKFDKAYITLDVLL